MPKRIGSAARLAVANSRSSAANETRSQDIRGFSGAGERPSAAEVASLLRALMGAHRLPAGWAPRWGDGGGGGGSGTGSGAAVPALSGGARAGGGGGR